MNYLFFSFCFVILQIHSLSFKSDVHRCVESHQTLSIKNLHPSLDVSIPLKQIMRNTFVVLALFSLFLLATSQVIPNCTSDFPKLKFCDQINYPLLNVVAQEAEKTDKFLEDQIEKVMQQYPKQTDACRYIVKRNMCGTNFPKCVVVDGKPELLRLCNVEMCYPLITECFGLEAVEICGTEMEPKNNASYWYPPNCNVYGSGSISSLSIPLLFGVLIALFFA